MTEVVKLTHDNDNDELTFITLGAATLNVIRFLEGTEQHHEDRERHAQRDGSDKQNPDDNREGVDQRLLDLSNKKPPAEAGGVWPQSAQGGSAVG